MSNEKATADAYAAVIADLEAQRAKIDEAIATVKAIQSGGKIPLPPSNFRIEGAIPTESTPEIALDEFHMLTVSQAIRKYLGMRGRKPATTAEIVEALTQGGQAGSDGGNFTVVVNNTLNRMQAPDGGISKVKRGVWGLSEWYQNKATD